MYRTLDTVALADGTKADIVVIQAPDADYRDSVLSLLAHKSDPWQVHLRAALEGHTDCLETRWYLAIMNGTPVANVMTVERNGVGILGHVYTMEQHRQKGLCKATLTNVMTDFRQRSGKALVLGTGYESVAYRIYEAFGFRSLKDGFMQYLSEPQDRFDAEWFGPADATVQTARWEHWPLVAMLGARDDGTGLRSAAWGLQDVGNLEAAYCSFMAQVQKGEATGTVAVSETGAVVACATSTPFRVGAALLPNVWLIDAFAHPLHGFKLTPTVAALPRREGKEIAFVPVSDEARVAAFADAGFVREGLLRGLLRTDLLPGDVAVMGRSSDGL